MNDEMLNCYQELKKDSYGVKPNEYIFSSMMNHLSETLPSMTDENLQEVLEILRNSIRFG